MFDDPYFPAITLGSELVAGSFWRDLQGEYWNGLVPARPLYQGVRKSVGDPETSRERVSDWGGPATVWALLCVAERRATRPNGEWGYITRCHMLGPERLEVVSPERGVVLTDLQSFIDCQ